MLGSKTLHMFNSMLDNLIVPSFAASCEFSVGSLFKKKNDLRFA